MAKIIIKRKSAIGGCIRSFDVYLMNTYIGELKNGSTLETQVDIGSHMLYFKDKLNFKPDVSFEAVVNVETEIVELKAKLDLNGNLIIEYADNAPHVPMYYDAAEQSKNSDLASASSTSIVKKSRLRCPRCGGYNLTPISETSSQGKDFNSGNACCGYALCGPLGLLFGFSGEGKQVSTVTYWLCSDCGNKFRAQ